VVMSVSITPQWLRNANYTLVATTTITLVGFTLEAFAFWPGLMSVDSIVQYTQAVLRHYSDQHPPVMAWLWSWTDRVVTGPGGMLIVHLGLLWIGLWAIAEGARRRGLRHAWLVPLVGFMPTIANIAGVIWKDVGMAYALLCAGGLLYASHRVKRATRVVAIAAALILMAYATMARANAAAATLAVACYWVAVAFPRARLPRAIVGGVTVIALLLVVQQIVERKALNASHQYLSQLILLFDLTGIACGGADVEIPDAFRVPTKDASMLCKAYDPIKLISYSSLPTVRCGCRTTKQPTNNCERFGSLRFWLTRGSISIITHVLFRGCSAFAVLPRTIELCDSPLCRRIPGALPSRPICFLGESTQPRTRWLIAVFSVDYCG